MMEMKEQTGSRKKYLAPVVVLMLCLVALTGAAYAYTSSTAITGNTVAANEFSLQVYQGNTDTVLSSPITLNKVTFYPQTTVTSGDDTVVVYPYTDSIEAATGKVTITASEITVAGNHALTASVHTNKETTQTVTVSGGTGPLTFTITAQLFTDSACEHAFNSGDQVAFTAGGVATLYYKVTAAVDGDMTFSSADGKTCALNVTEAFKTASVFTLTFSADGPVA